MTPARRRVRSLLVTLGVAAAGVLLASSPASAHPYLQGSNPAAGQVVSIGPSQVLLRFGEPVATPVGGIKVYDPRLARVDVGTSGHLSHQANVIGVAVRLHGVGTYRVTYRVLSDDSHVVDGALTFSVGAPSSVDGAVSAVGPGARVTAAAYSTSRFLSYVGLVLGAGGALALLLLWPRGTAIPARARTVVTGGAGLLAAGTSLSWLLYGAYVSGDGISSSLSSATVAAITHSGVGQAMGLRAALSLLLLPLVVLALARPGRALRATTLTVLLAAASSWALLGHPSTGAGRWWAQPTAAVHILAVTAWLGVLAVLVVLLPKRRPAVVHAYDEAAVLDRPLETAAALPAAESQGAAPFSMPDRGLQTFVPRASRLAFASVVALVVSGTAEAVREVRTVPALLHTSYGHWVLVMVAGMAVLIALGWRARRLAGTSALTALRRGVLVEAAIAVGLLAAATALVVAVPARQAYATPLHREIAAGSVTLSLTVDRPRPGLSRVHLTGRNADGTAHPLLAVEGTITLPAQDVGPLPVTWRVDTAGRADGTVTFPATGTWVLSMDVTTSLVEAPVVAATLPIS